MTELFRPGDVVRLKSGGPKMTVTSMGDDGYGKMKVWCDWFDGTRKMDNDFEPSSLAHVQEAAQSTGPVKASPWG